MRLPVSGTKPPTYMVKSSVREANNTGFRCIRTRNTDTHHRGLKVEERATRWTCLAIGMGGMLVTSGIVLVWLVGGAQQAGDEEANQGFRRLWALSLSWFDDGMQNECPHSAMKTVVVVWQTVTQVSAIAKTGYTNRYMTFLSTITFANLDVGSIIFCPCASHLDFHQNLLWATTWPLVVLVVLGGVYGWAARRSIPSRHALAVVRFRLGSVAFLVLFFVYASVTFTIFQTFACDAMVVVEQHLRADPAPMCFPQLHRVCVAYASVMVAIYPIGVPVLFVVWRIRTRHDMDPEGTEQNTGGIQHRSNVYTVCRPALFNYDVIECARRALLAACLTFGKSGGRLQVTVLLLNTFVPLFVESLYSFRSQFETFIYRWGNNIVISSYFVALLVNASVSSADTLVVAVLCDVLIVANLFMIVAVVIEFLISMTKLLICHIYPENLGGDGWPSGTNEWGIDAVV